MANTVFFKAYALAFEEPPQGRQGNIDAALLQFTEYRRKRHIRFPGKARKQPVLLYFKKERTMATHPFGRHAACPARLLGPLHNA